jgi:UDP-2,3-diacylglucosamine pyrophosphatase LpxH
VICGHIHHPASRDIGGVHYVNCGDWIESCTVVVETLNGGLEILWTPPQELAPVSQRARAA